jgi:hypothetical protein
MKSSDAKGNRTRECELRISRFNEYRRYDRSAGYIVLIRLAKPQPVYDGRRRFAKVGSEA